MGSSFVKSARTLGIAQIDIDPPPPLFVNTRALSSGLILPFYFGFPFF